MGRPTTKADLVVASDQKFKELWMYIDCLSPKDQEAAFCFPPSFLDKKKEAHWKRDQNLRDVLIHLYEWHRLLLNWAALNLEGTPTPFLPAPYNWRTYGALNQTFVVKHQQTSLALAKKLVCESHQQVMQLIASFSTEELFNKQVFPWTGTTSLGSSMVSVTSSHYDWASKKIKAYIKIQAQ